MSITTQAYSRALDRQSELRHELSETRFALDRLIDAAPPEILDELLRRWLSYGAACFAANGFTPTASDVGLGTYRTLLAAKLRAEARAGR